MSQTVSALDHIGLIAPDLDAIARQYERLGFQLTPLSQHSAPHVPGGPALPIGSANRCAMLRRGYIELLAIIDPTLPDNQLGLFLKRYAGIHIIAFAVDDADANVTRLRAAGLSEAKIAPLERMADTPQGKARVAFARIPLPPGEAPEGRIQLIQHLTPDVMWQPHLLDHPNHAAALIDTIICVADPDESVRRFARLTGIAPLRQDDTWRLPFAHSGITIVTQRHLSAMLPQSGARNRPFIAAYIVATDDGNRAAAALLARNDVMHSRHDDLLIVPPHEAGGATLVFSASETAQISALRESA